MITAGTVIGRIVKMNKYIVTLKTGDQMEFLAKDIEELEYLVLSEIALSWDIRLVQENE